MLLTLILAFLTTGIFCQSDFVVEGRSIRTATIRKEFHFGYWFQDTLTLVLADSVHIYSNMQKTIIKTEEFRSHGICPHNRIEYLTSSGKDSITKLFDGEVLKSIYSTKYDSLDRIHKYSLENFVPGMNGFEWLYEYQDSLTPEGKITITTIYIVEEGRKSVHFKVFDEFNEKNQKTKQTRGDSLNDPFAQVVEYKYDESGQLAEKIVSTDGLRYNNQILPALCQRESEITLESSDINLLQTVIRGLLEENATILQSTECENLVYTYNCSHPKLQIRINKWQPYWEGGVNVEIIQIKDQ